MGKSLTQRIIEKHLINSSFEDKEWLLKIDQTLTQDATGTMAYLQFETLGIPKVRTKLSVSYLDHNITKTGKQNAEFLETFSDRYGILFSKSGNGICHQVHLERFGKPGESLLGSDSHTPTAGGLGCLAIGAGGLDVAIAMAGQPFYLSKQKIIGVELIGKLNDWVSAKDIILELLRRLTVKGGSGKILEYFGEGIKTLTVPERATITNMGAELGATTSIFPSDTITKEFLKAQKREEDFIFLEADSNPSYDEIIKINLSELEPLIAMPSMPDNVKKVRDIEGVKIKQVIIGSCTNSSYKDLSLVANILKNNRPKKGIELHINPGSKQVIETLRKNKLLDYIKSKAVINSPSCLGCIGMGQFPRPMTPSIRTFNRNFEGRSGTKDDRIYLCSPEVAIASAIFGKITDPKKLGEYPKIKIQTSFMVDDHLILKPSGKKKIKRGKMIAPLPTRREIQTDLKGKVLIKVGDNITTDDIIPAGKKLLPLRSHIPKISRYVFYKIDKNFALKAKKNNGGFIIGGENYGQGSSREHAALAPMYLGIKAVIAKSFSRIHKSNLINFGILPLEFENKGDFDKIKENDSLLIKNIINLLINNNEVVLENLSKNEKISLSYLLSERDIKILSAGGLLNYIKNKI